MIFSLHVHASRHQTEEILEALAVKEKRKKKSFKRPLKFMGQVQFLLVTLGEIKFQHLKTAEVGVRINDSCCGYSGCGKKSDTT